PAQAQSHLGLQYDLVLTTGLKLESVNPIEVHDDRAVNTNELFITQVFLELRQRPTQDVRFVAHVQAGVIVRSLDPVDVRDIQEQHLALISDYESLCCPLLLWDVMGKPLLGTIQSTSKARIIEGLQQVVERAGLEGA